MALCPWSWESDRREIRTQQWQIELICSSREGSQCPIGLWHQTGCRQEAFLPRLLPWASSAAVRCPLSAASGWETRPSRSLTRIVHGYHYNWLYWHTEGNKIWWKCLAWCKSWVEGFFDRENRKIQVHSRTQKCDPIYLRHPNWGPYYAVNKIKIICNIFSSRLWVWFLANAPTVFSFFLHFPVATSSTVAVDEL